MSPITAGAEGEPRAWGWVAHLREGGTTPWQAWAAPAEPQGAFLPGAQQLELLRRLNAAGAAPAVLAHRVLTCSAPGRGHPELALVGAGDPPPFGLPPVDPARLPDDELVRVAAGLLAEDLAAATVPDDAGSTPRPWRRPYRLVGDPWLADPLRAGLSRIGRPPGGPRPVVLAVGTDLATMLTHAWALRCFGPGVAPWEEFLDDALRPGRLPLSIDLVRSARHWEERVGPRRLHVVLGAAEAARRAGASRRRLRAVTRHLPAVPADGAELARRIGPVLAVLVSPERRELLLRRVLLPRVADRGPRLAVPGEQRRRVRRRATQMRDALLADRYAVHGDPDSLLARPESGAAVRSQPDAAAVLSLALQLLREEPAASVSRPERGDEEGKEAT